MSMGMYKQGQGYWTRMMTAIGVGVIVAAGAMWLWQQFALLTIEKVNPLYVQGSAAGIVMLIGALLVYWFVYCSKKTGEFLIAVEGEMRKVNWPSRQEVMGSTWVVIALSIILAAILFTVDIGFSTFFKAINVLEQT